jgi:hypothetical protein
MLFSSCPVFISFISIKLLSLWDVADVVQVHTNSPAAVKAMVAAAQAVVTV